LGVELHAEAVAVGFEFLALDVVFPTLTFNATIKKGIERIPLLYLERPRLVEDRWSIGGRSA
jgi:hypothetical protein